MDVELSSRIGAEETARSNADAALEKRIDHIDRAVGSAAEVKEVVGRIVGTEDFTVYKISDGIHEEYGYNHFSIRDLGLEAQNIEDKEPFLLMNDTRAICEAITGKEIKTVAGFKDTSGHYAEAHINKLKDMGIANGDNNGNFRPDDKITRADAAIMVANAVRYITGK